MAAEETIRYWWYPDHVTVRLELRVRVQSGLWLVRHRHTPHGRIVLPAFVKVTSARHERPWRRDTLY